MIEVYKYNSHYVIILSINKLNIMAVFNYYKNSPIHETSYPSTDFSSLKPEISELKNSSCAGLLSLI